jgi:hypothetical protein
MWSGLREREQSSANRRSNKYTKVQLQEQDKSKLVTLEGSLKEGKLMKEKSEARQRDIDVRVKMISANLKSFSPHSPEHAELLAERAKLKHERDSAFQERRKWDNRRKEITKERDSLKEALKGVCLTGNRAHTSPDKENRPTEDNFHCESSPMADSNHGEASSSTNAVHDASSSLNDFPCESSPLPDFYRGLTGFRNTSSSSNSFPREPSPLTNFHHEPFPSINSPRKPLPATIIHHKHSLSADFDRNTPSLSAAPARSTLDFTVDANFYSFGSETTSNANLNPLTMGLPSVNPLANSPLVESPVDAMSTSPFLGPMLKQHPGYSELVQGMGLDVLESEDIIGRFMVQYPGPSYA